MTRALLLLPLLLLCAGCLGPVESLYPPSHGQVSRDLYIYSNHWHTGVVVKRADLSPQAQQCFAAFKGYPWLEIGWGDDGFYRAPEATTGLALGAMFCSGGTTLHVVGVDPNPPAFYRRYDVDLYHIRISEEGMRQMEAYILDSMARDPAGRCVEVQKGLYEFSRFYAARGSYHLFHTCNNWTAEVVRKTGFPITPVYAQTASNLGFQLCTFGPEDVVVGLGR